MNFSSGLFAHDEFHAQFLGPQGELPEDPLAVALLVVILALIGVFLALGEHRDRSLRNCVRPIVFFNGLLRAARMALITCSRWTTVAP